MAITLRDRKKRHSQENSQIIRSRNVGRAGSLGEGILPSFMNCKGDGEKKRNILLDKADRRRLRIRICYRHAQMF